MSNVLFECPDVSNFQGNINFKSMRNAGYRAVMIRAGWGQNNEDPKFESNAQACVNLGIPAGIYWFSYALNDQAVLREAEFAIKKARKHWQVCPIAFDLEYDSRSYAARNGVTMDKTMCTRHAKLFLNAVKEAGYIPILYTNRDYLKNYFDLSEILAAVPETQVWFAFYSGSEPAELEKSAMWQYTSKGSVPGISGNVDINKVYKDIFLQGQSQAVTQMEYRSYTVVKGDTLSKIGSDLKVSWQEIAASNGIKSPYTIYPGQVLKIPYKDSVPASGQDPVCNLYIKSFQAACNADGNKLTENGIDDLQTQAARKKIELKAKWTIWGYRAGSSGAVVRWLQERLNELGYLSGVDGKYGPNTRNAVIKFQRAYNLTVDGIAGYNTLQQLFYI